jgi:hypothetical protein
MSLTHRLKGDHALSQMLSGLVLETRAINADILAPPLSTNYALVGTAFDYLMRMELSRRVKNAHATKWVAEMALDIIAVDPDVLSHPMYDTIVHGFADAIRVAKTRLSDYIAEPSLEKLMDLAMSALTLAKMDSYYRSGIVDRTLFTHEKKDAEDLMHLFEIVPWDQFMKSPLFLNPDFGRFSQMMNGADADIIAGDTLFDIKTTKHTEMRPHLAQLMGYVILSESYRKERPERPRISKIGIYFSRHGHIETIDISDVIGSLPYEEAKTKLLGGTTIPNAMFA